MHLLVSWLLFCGLVLAFCLSLVRVILDLSNASPYVSPHMLPSRSNCVGDTENGYTPARTAVSKTEVSHAPNHYEVHSG